MIVIGKAEDKLSLLHYLQATIEEAEITAKAASSVQTIQCGSTASGEPIIKF